MIVFQAQKQKIINCAVQRNPIYHDSVVEFTSKECCLHGSKDGGGCFGIAALLLVAVLCNGKCKKWINNSTSPLRATQELRTSGGHP